MFVIETAVIHDLLRSYVWYAYVYKNPVLPGRGDVHYAYYRFA